jgi:hypothetical protein
MDGLPTVFTGGGAGSHPCLQGSRSLASSFCWSVASWFSPDFTQINLLCLPAADLSTADLFVGDLFVGNVCIGNLSAYQ